MKLSIRLQNHGKKNHPLWWIVVAPNRRNIFGRFTQHVGYWSPRHGYYLQREIVLNIPRIKYWMSCGAVPTFKVQKFLSLWNILPTPWYYKKSEQQMQKEKKPVEELNDKQKRKLQAKQKRKVRQALPQTFYYKQQRRFRLLSKWNKKVQTLLRIQQRENQVLRELLLYNEFTKLAKIQQLSGKTSFNDTQQLAQLRTALSKAKAQLGLLKRNYQSGLPYQQTKVMKTINQLCKKIRDAQSQRATLVGAGLDHLEEEDGQLLSEDLLKAKLQYQRIVKKIQKNFNDLEEFSNLNQPVLLQEYADFLVLKNNIDPQKAYIEAQKQFIERGVSGTPVVKYELVMYDQLQKGLQDQNSKHIHKDLIDADLQTILKKAIQWGDCILPSRRSVHPIPDFDTYHPEQYYEPIYSHDFKIKVDDSLSPLGDLQKYHQKKEKKAKLVI